MLDLYNQADFSGDVARPLEKYGLRIMSLGMSAKQDQAFIWRGPLVSKMIHNLLDKVEWGRLDYLVVDLPPGTGDPSISVAHSIPDAEIVMVTTPQKLALADVRRAVNLFNLYHLDIIGLVENMSYFACGHGDKVFDIFGRGGGDEFSRESDIPLLGSIPLDLAVRKSEDSGKPLMVGAPDSEAGRIVQDIAGKISGWSD
ncbi:MAG: P-loop NTPase [Desulfurivibrionaceae bacterium]